MPKPIADIIQEVSTTTGTSDFTLTAVNGRRRFSTVFGTGAPTNIFDYYILNQAQAEWEIGTGHMSGASTLVRDTVILSSNANAAVNFSAGTKDVVNDMPASTQVALDLTQTLTNKDLTSITNALGSIIGIQLLTATGTYTPTSGTKSALVVVQAAGGGGGGVGTTSGLGVGGGAGAGETRLYVLTGVTGTYSFTIGALGAGGASGNNAGGTAADTTFGTGPLVTAKGGTGGGGSTGATAGSSGSTPTGSGGILLPPTRGPRTSIVNGSWSIGGSSIFGDGGTVGAPAVDTTDNSAGADGEGYGAGGAGGRDGGTAARTGAAGSAGAIIVVEFK